MTIEVTSLTKKFGKLVAVDSVSFRVAKGEIFSLLGPNGAGKTTLVRLLSTLLKPDHGEASLAGFSIRTNAKLVRRNLGIVSDGIAIYEHLKPSENLEFFGIQYGMEKNEIRERKIELFDLLDLNDPKTDIPVKFHSTGMKRKVEIAVALIHNPQVILCDEITAGLDPQMAILLREKIQNLAKKENKTILWTTHYLNEPEAIADRIGILYQGKLISIGTLEELRHLVSLPNQDYIGMEDIFVFLMENPPK